ncbi:hypothetical protein D3C84_533370 [compost metagenome]
MPSRRQVVAQLRGGLPALVAGASRAAGRIGAYAVGAAEGDFFRAVEVARGPLGVQLSEQLEAIGQSLQAHCIQVQLVEAAGLAGTTPVLATLQRVADAQAAMAVAQRDADLPAAEQAVLAVAADSRDPQADVLLAA